MGIQFGVRRLKDVYATSNRVTPNRELAGRGVILSHTVVESYANPYHSRILGVVGLYLINSNIRNIKKQMEIQLTSLPKCITKQAYEFRR